MTLAESATMNADPDVRLRVGWAVLTYAAELDPADHNMTIMVLSNDAEYSAHLFIVALCLNLDLVAAYVADGAAGLTDAMLIDAIDSAWPAIATRSFMT